MFGELFSLTDKSISYGGGEWWWWWWWSLAHPTQVTVCSTLDFLAPVTEDLAEK